MVFQLNPWPEGPPAPNDAAPPERRTGYTSRITSPEINSEVRFPADRPIFFTVLTMTRPSLRNLLMIQEMNGVVEQILVGQQGFLFYETLNARW